MDPRRLRAGEWILGAGSVLLLLSLFLTWYDGKNVEVRGFEPLADYSLTGFEAFRVVDLILAGGALLGLTIVVLSAMQAVSAVNIAAVSLMTPIAAGLVLVSVFRAVWIPDFDAEGAVFYDVTRSGGIWVALAGSALMLAGVLAAMRDERITGDTRSVDPADIETLSAPQAGA